MQIGSEKWVAIIMDGAAQMGLAVSGLQAAQFTRHAQLLMQWNRKINLTAITDPTEVAVKHYLDAIAPLNHIPPEGRLLDIGTGGGFPGIPLKVMRPNQAMTLIDSVRKKINFVKFAIRELGLDRIEAVHARAEEYGRQIGKSEKFEVIVCRALADPTAIVQIAAPLLVDEGCIVAFHGPRDASQYSGGLFSSSVMGHPFQFHASNVAYQLPILGDHRCVSILKAVKP